MNENQYSDLLIGINRITFEVIENYAAFVEIIQNLIKHEEDPVPIPILMLLKNHFQIYIIESSKILLSGDNHFLINTALNHASRHLGKTEEVRELKKKLNELKEVKDQIKSARNKIFAHLDASFSTYYNNMDFNKLELLNNTVINCVNFLNDSMNLYPKNDYRFFKPTTIRNFYKLIFDEPNFTELIDNLELESNLNFKDPGN